MEDLHIPGYRIEKEIGRGGMAIVYLAVQESLDRPAAIKVMLPAMAADPTFGQRFQKEARTVAQLNHPHIMSVYDVGTSGPYHYMAMEYIDGGDLKHRIRRGLTAGDSLQILKQLSMALIQAHAKGYVHRDIKAANILFRRNGSAILADFGIAKAIGSNTRLTVSGMRIGTPRYMSPEQVSGDSVDGRSDLYSLGVVFYEMLTGEPPYDATDAMAIAYAHVNNPIPALPARLARFQPLIDRLMAKSPHDRFVDADHLLSAIERLQAGENKKRQAIEDSPTLQQATDATERRPSGSKAIKWGVLGIALALLVGFGIRFFIQHQAASPSLAMGTYRANSSPEGAQIFVDGELKGRTPLLIRTLRVGERQVVVKLKYHNPQLKKVAVKKGMVAEDHFVLLRGIGSIAVSTDPQGMDVYLDAKKLNRISPLTIDEVSAGMHRIKSIKSGYYEQQREIEVLPGQTARVSLELTPWRKTRLFVQAEPTDAVVKILNIKEKFTQGIQLKPGRYHIQASKDNHQPMRQWVDLSGEPEMRISLRLTSLGAISVSGSPKGADVFLDNRKVGRIPCTLKGLAAKPYVLRVENNQYVSVNRTIELRAGITNTVTIDLKMEPAALQAKLEKERAEKEKLEKERLAQLAANTYIVLDLDVDWPSCRLGSDNKYIQHDHTSVNARFYHYTGTGSAFLTIRSKDGDSEFTLSDSRRYKERSESKKLRFDIDRLTDEKGLKQLSSVALVGDKLHFVVEAGAHAYASKYLNFKHGKRSKGPTLWETGKKINVVAPLGHTTVIRAVIRDEKADIFVKNGASK